MKGCGPNFEAWRATGTGFDSEIPADDVDPMILANLSVWESAEALAAFAYRSAHSYFVKHGAQWFEPAREAYQVMWWIPAGSRPQRAEAFAKLELVRTRGASVEAFDFRTRFPAPILSDLPA